MNIQITPNTRLDVHPTFWRDWKSITKNHHGSEFSSSYSLVDLKSLPAETRLESFPLLAAIKQTIINLIVDGNIDGQAPPYDRQHSQLYADGWTIRKMRWAINQRGKSSGLRVIFIQNKTSLIFIFIATKNTCANERNLESTFMPRIKEYFNI